ncbi:MAG: intradiol ring-cleavage dioxygenase [Robiginitomaculum sp.]|nr:MAG: intradiol ring-cleavage dioxygenase [Robiginitomaculum sp.]
MQALTERRAILGWIGAASATALIAGCGGSEESTTTSGTVTTGGGSNGLCLVDPTETNGPYPSDGSNRANGSTSNILTQTGVIRQDLRTSFGAYTGTATGVELQLTITIVNVNDGCSPLEGYVVYLWHCDAIGQYSIYDLPSENYLRGVGISDSNGEVVFTTIVPGCYPGRFPHTHFEIFESETTATHYDNRLLVSQMVVPETVCEEVYNNASGYGQSASNLSRVSIASDNVFADNSSDEIAMQTPELSGNITNGYTGTVEIGIRV